MAAAGHFGRQSKDLVKHYAQDLGFEYLTASDKETFESAADKFFDPNIRERSIILEVFTETEEESEALKATQNIFTDKTDILKEKIKGVVRKVVPMPVLKFLHKITGL